MVISCAPVLRVCLFEKHLTCGHGGPWRWPDPGPCSGRMPTGHWAGVTRVCCCSGWSCHCSPRATCWPPPAPQLLRDIAKSTGLYPLWSARCPHLKIPTQLSALTPGEMMVFREVFSFLLSVCVSHRMCFTSVQGVCCSAWRLRLLIFLFVCFPATVLITNKFLSV